MESYSSVISELYFWVIDYLGQQQRGPLGHHILLNQLCICVGRRLLTVVRPALWLLMGPPYPLSSGCASAWETQLDQTWWQRL